MKSSFKIKKMIVVIISWTLYSGSCLILFAIEESCRYLSKTYLRFLSTLVMNEDEKKVLSAFVKLGGIAFYAYVCSNTNIFDVEPRSTFLLESFLFPVILLLAIGFLYIGDSQTTDFMNKHLTEEWKGWMQLVILVYHYTGGLHYLPVYVIMRGLVSSYLFLNSFGHSLSAIKMEVNQEKSLQIIMYNAGLKLFKAVVRLNFFFVLLCLTLNYHYNHFYFVTLITFWFIFLYLFILWPCQLFVSKLLRCVYMLTLTFSVMILSPFLYKSEVIFKYVFHFYPWEFPMSSDEWTLDGWRFRLEMDKFSSCYGTIFAILVYYLSKKWDFNWIKMQKKVFEIIICLISLIGIILYGAFVGTFDNREKYLEFHPSTIIIPIIGYLLLRNLVTKFRQTYSLFFTWFGKFSLELYLAQFHFWIIGSQQGHLVLIRGFPFANLILTTVIFVLLSHEMSEITNTILSSRTIATFGKAWKLIEFFPIIIKRRLIQSKD